MNKKLFLLMPFMFALAACGGNGESTTSSSTSQPKGELISTVTMTACTDMTEDGVFEKNGATVTVTQGECSQTVKQAIDATKTYEFRVYAKMHLNFSCGQSFKTLVVKFSNYTSDKGQTYYFDYEDVPGARSDIDMTNYETTLTLDSAATSFDFTGCYHQTRIATVAFYK